MNDNPKTHKACRRMSGHPSTLVYDPGPPRCIAACVRRLERAQARSSNSPLTLHPLRLAVALWLALVAGLASAQGYPNRPVRMIVGQPAGGNADLTARLYLATPRRAIWRAIRRRQSRWRWRRNRHRARGARSARRLYVVPRPHGAGHQSGADQEPAFRHPS